MFFGRRFLITEEAQIFGPLFEAVKKIPYILTKNGLVYFWAIFSQTLLVTLLGDGQK
jgi:hypothetical protein